MVATTNLKYILNNDRKNLCTRNSEPWSSNTMVSGYFGDDGTLYVSTSGAITANSNLYFADTFLLQAGVDYKFGLCPGSGPVRLALVNATGEWVANQFGTTPSTYTPSATGKFSMYVYIYSGTNITNHPITPMICPSEVWDYDPTYVQPARTNAELTVLEAEDRAALAEEIDARAKQLVDLSNTGSGTHNDVTFTNLGNNIYKVNGTPSATDTHLDIMGTWSTVPSFLSNNVGKTIVFATNHDHIYYGIIPIVGGSALEYVGGNKTTPVAYTIPSKLSGALLRIYVDTNHTYDNVTAELLICTKAAFNVSPKFVPYRPAYDLVSDYVAIPRTKLVYIGINRYATAQRYTMKMSDFVYSQFDASTSQCGSYLISVVTWEVTPKQGLWIVSYSGGQMSYAVLTNIVGSDAANVSVVTDDGDPYIAVTASGKVAISTLN